MPHSRRVEWRQAPTEPGLSVDRDNSQFCIASSLAAGEDELLIIGRMVWDAACISECSIQSRKFEFIKNKYV